MRVYLGRSLCPPTGRPAKNNRSLDTRLDRSRERPRGVFLTDCAYVPPPRAHRRRRVSPAADAAHLDTRIASPLSVGPLCRGRRDEEFFGIGDRAGVRNRRVQREKEILAHVVLDLIGELDRSNALGGVRLADHLRQLAAARGALAVRGREFVTNLRPGASVGT